MSEHKLRSWFRLVTNFERYDIISAIPFPEMRGMDKVIPFKIAAIFWAGGIWGCQDAEP
jgi:hypothetical protein